jgi:hypothetical protein
MFKAEVWTANAILLESLTGKPHRFAGLYSSRAQTRNSMKALADGVGRLRWT